MIVKERTVHLLIAPPGKHKFLKNFMGFWYSVIKMGK